MWKCILLIIFLIVEKKMDVVAAIKKNKESEKIIDHDFVGPYYPESDEFKVPFKVSSGSASYNLYSTKEKNILPKSCELVSLDLRWAIPQGFYGKIFSCSGLLLNHLVTAEGGVIDSDYRGNVKVMLFNHSDQIFSVKMGQRIAQVVFIEKFDVRFEMVQSSESLQKTARNEGGFGSSGSNDFF